MSNHFDLGLDDNEAAVAEDVNHAHDYHHGDGHEHDTGEYVETIEAEEPSKRKIPTIVLIAGAAVLSIGGMFVYKKVIAPKPSYSTPTMEMSASNDASSHGMMQAQGKISAAPSAPNNAPDATLANSDVSQAALPGSPDANPAAGQTIAPANGSVKDLTGDTATNAQKQTAQPQQQPSTGLLAKSNDATRMDSKTQASNSAQGAESDGTADEVARLRDELQRTKSMLAQASAQATPAKLDRQAHSEQPSHFRSSTARHKIAKVNAASMATTTASVDLGKPVVVASVAGKGEGIQMGFHIRQIVPGQAWVEDEHGRVTVIGIGDKLDGSEVLKIDADSGEIQTTAGLIR